MEILSSTSCDIRLRAPEPTDISWMTCVENDAELFPLGISTGPYAKYHIEQYIANNTNDIYQDGSLRLVIEDARYKAMGMIDLHNFDSRHLRAEIGIVLLSSFRKQGIALKALTLLEDFSFRHIGLHQLVAYTFTHNHAANALFERLGYHSTGTLLQWHRVGTDFQDLYIYQKINPY